MTETWPQVRLGTIITERRETPDVADVAAGMYPIISKISFGPGTIELRSEIGSRTNMILVRPGDLLISGINANKGAIAVYDEESAKPAAATIHYSAYEVKKDRAHADYLWWFLRSEEFRKILLGALPNGIKTELKSSRLLCLEIPLPSLDEQRRIVSQMEDRFNKVKIAHRSRLEAKSLADTAMDSMIGAQMGGFPITGSLGEVLTVKPRSGPSFATSRDWSGTPVLMPSSVTGFGVDVTKVEYGAGAIMVSEKDQLQPGDILIARGNKRDQVGNAGIVPPEAAGYVCANLLMRMRLDEKLADASFCIYWLRSPMIRKYVLEHMTGTSPHIQKINQKTVLALPFPTKTPVVEQRRVVRLLDRLQKSVDALRRLQEETGSAFDALAPSISDREFSRLTKETS